MNTPKELNDAADREHRPTMRNALKSCAIRLFDALDDVALAPTAEGLQRVNGLWAQGEKLLKAAQEPEPPAPVSGPTVATQFEERKAA